MKTEKIFNHFYQQACIALIANNKSQNKITKKCTTAQVLHKWAIFSKRRIFATFQSSFDQINDENPIFRKALIKI